MKKTLKNLIGAGLVSLASLLPMKSNAQPFDTIRGLYFTHETVPRVIINPWTHKDNSQWNYANKEQKIQMLEQAFQEDTIYKHPYVPWDYECTSFALQTSIDYNGFPELDTMKLYPNFADINIINNGKFKIPVFKVDLENSDKGGHTINAVLVGKEITNFNDWYFFEPQAPPHLKKVNPGDWSMDLNSFYVNLFFDGYFDNEFDFVFTQDTITRNRGPPPNFLYFHLNNGNPVFDSIDTRFLLDKNPIHDSIPPQINFSINNDSLEISSNDNYSFLDSAWYFIDNTRRNLKCKKEYCEQGYMIVYDINNMPVYETSQKIPLNSLSAGEHTLKIYSRDYAGNLDSLITNFNIPVGIKENFDNFSLENPYPNPVKSNLTIPYSTKNKEDIYLNLFDATGKNLETLTQSSSGKNQFEINMNNYSSGIYFYVLSSGKGISKKGKFIKE